MITIYHNEPKFDEFLSRTLRRWLDKGLISEHVRDFGACGVAQVQCQTRVELTTTTLTLASLAADDEQLDARIFSLPHIVTISGHPFTTFREFRAWVGAVVFDDPDPLIFSVSWRPGEYARVEWEIRLVIEEK